MKVIHCCWLIGLYSTLLLAEVLQTDVPRGFEYLDGPQTQVMDVYYNGDILGAFTVTVDGEQIRFYEPQQIVSGLVNIDNRLAVERSLSDWLDINRSLLCKTDQTFECGVLHPAVAGVIVNNNEFRADLFINPDFIIQNQREPRYLPISKSRSALLQGLAVNFSGSEGARQENAWDLFGRTLFGWQDQHVESNWNTGSRDGLRIETLKWARDVHGQHYSAGFLDSQFSYSRFIYSHSIAGISLGSSDDTLLNKSASYSTPLEVVMPMRGIVEVLKDGRIIHSQMLDNGYQTINTSHFPAGTYNIVTRIKSTGGALLSETEQLFVKQYRIRTGDHFSWFLEGGSITDTVSSGLPDSTDEWLARGGVETGLGKNVGGQLSFASSNTEQVAEAGLGYTSPSWFLSGSLLAGAQQQTGASGSVEYSTRNWWLQAETRRIWNSPHPEERKTCSGCLTTPQKAYDTVSYNQSLFAGNLSLRVTHREQYRDDDLTKSLTYHCVIFRQMHSTVGLGLEFSESSGAYSGKVAIDILQDQDSWTHRADARHLYSRNQSGESSHDTGVSLKSSWQNNQPDRLQDRRADIGADFSELQKSIYGSFHSGSGLGELDISATHQIGSSLSGSDNQEQSGTSYAGALSTSLTVNRNGIAYGGTQRADSAVTVSISGASSKDTFHVLVNDQVQGFASGRGATVIPLPAFASYKIAIKESGTGFFEGCNKVFPVTLYPGNVEHLSFEVWRTIVIFGRLLDSRNEIQQGFCSDDQQLPVCINEYGIFQTEVRSTSRKLAFSKAGQSCEVAFDPGLAEEGILNLGDIICR